MTVRCVRSIQDVDPRAWDRLAADRPLASHGWLQANEADWGEQLERYYFLIDDEAGKRLVAATACYLEPRQARFETSDDLLFGRMAATPVGRLLSLRPALVCGSPWAGVSNCLTDPEAGSEQRSRWILALATAMRQIAATKRLGIIFLSVSENETALQDCLHSLGFVHATHEAVFDLEIAWPDFKSYRNSLPSKNIRKNMRWERNKCRKSGIQIEELDDPAPFTEDLYRIVSGHYQRYGWPTFPFRAGWFERLKALLGERALITVARKGTSIIGVSVSLRMGGVRQMILACIDHEAAGESLAHFDLGYYSPVEDCIRRGDRRYIVGPGQQLLKSRRGYLPHSVRVYCRACGGGRRMANRAWLRVLSAWLRRKARKAMI